MERRRGNAVTTAALSALDRIYLRRACELAIRGRGNTSPNPSVGAVIALGAVTLGEGFHHVRGEAHAEIEAFADAAARGNDVRGATMYVTLEPCDHTGLTPPCSRAVIGAGIARVVIGTMDPNPKTAGAGAARMRAAQLAVDVAEDAWSREIVAEFAIAVRATRPYVLLKLASSLDGYVAPRPGARHWLTGHESRAYVRDLRASHDAVLVGAGTVRVDDPQLSVRPPRARRKPYLRVVACEEAPVPLDRQIFEPIEGYGPTLVLAPAGARARFVPLEDRAEVAYIGDDRAATLDLRLALEALRARGIATVLCEGGPTLAGRLLEGGLVDRIDWLVAPVLLGNPDAVPALRLGGRDSPLHFERIATLGTDVLLRARLWEEKGHIHV